ncbi:Uncharacterized protein TCM_042325 [Theobroma cacao]|uniref:CBS domain-containing protein n=1 Tax=Theobroma cacao TaxID=3641 RepID=A0A061GY33_THECC|nr:Uncharacterized protein TCM_042325 [Theobroma cacao]
MVTPEAKILRAMQLMTDNRIRHIPVIVEKGMVGMGRFLEDDEILCVSPVMPHTCRT